VNLSRGYKHAGSSPAFSLVIPTHEGSTDWLTACLRSVVAQEDPTVLELLVVLDGPAPEAEKIVREVAPAARVLPLKRKRGFAGAAGEGLRTARGGLVGVLNDDARLDTGWVGAMIAAAEENPDAGSFASRVLREDEPGTIDSAGHGLTRWGEAFAIGAGASDGAPFDTPREVFGAPATAAVFRRELLLDVGGLDPTMEAYLEDVDLSLRAQVLGFPCLYVPTARAWHRGSASYGWGTSGSGRAEWLLARNRIHLLCKSMPRGPLLAAGPAVVLSILADLGHRSLTARHPLASLRGSIEGLRGLGTSLGARGAALGGMRIGEERLSAVLRAAELDLVAIGSGSQSGRWSASRARLSRLLTAWVDAREGRPVRSSSSTWEIT
jgi:GT2 family glycosyltransferase